MNVTVKPEINYTGTGTQTQYTIPFDYLRRAYVKVLIDREAVTDFTVKGIYLDFKEAPAVGADIYIYRDTPTTRLVSWADASILHAKDMTVQQVQQLHIIEEERMWIKNNSVILDDADRWDMRNHRVVRVADPVEDTDGVNKGYMETVGDGFVQECTALKDETKTLSNKAAASERAAGRSETQAKVYATSAESSRKIAEVQVTLAEAAATRASNSASSASTDSIAANLSRINAHTSEINARTSETNAKISENAAKSYENSANADANWAIRSADAAKTSETNAKASELNAKTSEDNAKASEEACASYEATVLSYKNSAEASATSAAESETNAKTSEDLAKQYRDEAASFVPGNIVSRLDQHDREISALYDMNEGKTFRYETDSTEAYTKLILSGAKAFDLKKLGGKSVVVNQLLDYTKAQHSTVGGLSIVNNNNGSFTISNVPTETSWSAIAFPRINCIVGHKYFLYVHSDLSNANVQCYLRDMDNNAYIFTGSGIVAYSKLIDRDNDFRVIVRATFNGNSFTVRPMCIDITQMFGTGNEPTLEQCREIFSADYYPYNEGTLLSVPVEQVVVRGKNLIPFPYNDTSKTINGVTFTVENDGAIRVNGVASTDTVFSVSTGEIMQIKPNTTYTVSGIHSIGSISGRIDLRVTDGKTTAYSITTVGGRLPFAYADVSKFRVNIEAKSGAVINNVVFKPQVELGESATSYSKYTSPNIIPIPASAKTDGWSAGNVANYVDFERKKFVKVVDRVKIGDLTWEYVNANLGIIYSRYFDGLAKTSTSDKVANILCDKWTTIAPNQAETTAGIYRHAGVIGIVVNGSGITNVNTFKQTYADTYIYFELATPIETDIDIDSRFEAILCEGGGSITFENGTDYCLPVMNEEEFLVKLSEV